MLVALLGPCAKRNASGPFFRVTAFKASALVAVAKVHRVKSFFQGKLEVPLAAIARALASSPSSLAKSAFWAGVGTRIFDPQSLPL